MIDAATLPVQDFVEAATTRLISTAYIEDSALGPLTEDPDDLAFLEHLEGLTSSRRGLVDFLPDGVHPEELVNEHHGYGWTYINAAFCYTRESGNRFNGPERGAWYASWGPDRVKTAQAEVAWHLTRELEATGIFDNRTAYRELNAAFATEFHTLSRETGEPCLHPDPEIGYPAGQALASDLRAKGSNGLTYPSQRQEGGLCLVAFRPALVQKVRQGDTWVFNWSGTLSPTITKSG